VFRQRKNIVSRARSATNEGVLNFESNDDHTIILTIQTVRALCGARESAEWERITTEERVGLHIAIAFHCFSCGEWEKSDILQQAHSIGQ
jgi:hypothetical protein